MRRRVPPLAEVESPLRRAYDRRIYATRKLGGLRVVAEALDAGELCRAQIAALHPQLSDPPASGAKSQDGEALGKILHAYGWLLKDWDPDAHPRTGVPPNPGWFAPKDSEGAPGQQPSGVEVANNDDAGTASDARPDYQVSQAEGGVDLPALTAGDPGWDVLKDGESPAPGDVVARQLGYTDASGHVMIVGDDDTFVGTGDPPGQPGGAIERIQARDFLGPPQLRDDPRFRRSPLVYRRWVGQ